MCTNVHGVKHLFSKPMAIFAVLFHITSELNNFLNIGEIKKIIRFVWV